MAVDLTTHAIVSSLFGEFARGPTRQLAAAIEKAGDDAKKKERAIAAHRPDMITLIGYVGTANDAAYVRLYIDPGLGQWVLIRIEDVVWKDTLHNDIAPGAERDVLWVKSDAQVSRGRQSPRPDDDEAHFLRGEFVSADELAVSWRADEAPGWGGAFLDGSSALCCRHGTIGPPYR
jgi:hypothetical protein